MITKNPIRRAEKEDSLDLCKILAETPMEGSVCLTQDRRPDYFHGAAVQCEQPEIYVSKQNTTSKIAGVFSAGSRRVFVNGQIQKLRYLSDLRITPGQRSGLMLARGFRFLRNEILENGEFAQTLVISENAKALDILTSHRRGLPKYFPNGEYDFYLISLRQFHFGSSQLQVRKASTRDIPAMQAFFDREAPHKQFFPVYDFTELSQNNYYRDAKLEDFFLAFDGEELIGLLGAWDQGNYKKTHVRGYGGHLRWLRPWLNAVSRLQGGIELPAPGTLQRTLYLHCAVCRENDPSTLTALLRAVQCGFAGQDYHHAALGLDRHDPLREALAGCRTMNFAGRHFLVSFGADPRPNLDDKVFYFEAARI